MRWLGSRIFVVYVALNMLVCSILFFPWARPRETVSGLTGRWLLTNQSGWKYKFARYARSVIHAIYFWEPEHCDLVHDVEAEAHKVLYPEKPGAKP